MRGRRSIWLAAMVLATLAPQASRAAAPAPFSEAAFAAAQSQGRTIVVETFAPWCLPCRIQAPILSRLLAREPFDGIVVLRIGERTPPAAWKRFRLEGYGSIVVFKGGREAARGTPTTEAALADLLRKGL